MKRVIYVASAIALAGAFTWGHVRASADEPEFFIEDSLDIMSDDGAAVLDGYADAAAMHTAIEAEADAVMDSVEATAVSHP